MPSLLVSPYQPQGAELLQAVASQVMAGQRLQAERDAQAQSMALRLAEAARQQQQFQQKLNFDQQQEARMQRQLDIQQSHYASIDERDRKRLALEEADKQPFTFDGGAAESNAPSVAEGLLGKVTSYGYSSDPYGDSASLGTGKWAGNGPTGAWSNRLRPSSLAISPDIEKLFKANGIKEGDSVALQLANGQIINRTWDDRTMQDAQAAKKFGKPLRGRFDFFSPGGEHELDGMQVVGFRPANALDKPLVSATPATEQPSIPATPTPQQQIRSMATQLAEMGVSRGDARKILTNTIPQLIAPKRSSTAASAPRIRRFADGSDRQYNSQTGEWDILEQKPGQDTSAKERQAEERLTLSKIKSEQSQLKTIEKKMVGLEEPSWPWEEGGKYYRTGFMGKKEITEDEFKSLKKEADSTAWAKLNHEAETRRQKIAELEGSMNGAAPAPAPKAPGAPTENPGSATPDLKMLAQRALDDPNASPEYKEAARKILAKK